MDTKLKQEILNNIFSDIVKFPDALEDANFEETPQRVLKMFDEFILSEKEQETELKKHFEKSFPSVYEGMILLTNIKTVSLCPHHLLPVFYVVHIGYIPSKGENSLVIGASKLARITETLAKRAILQEDFTSSIVSTLNNYLDPAGVACIVQGQHSCMTSRGVRQTDSSFVTSHLTGAFKENAETREEFFFHIKNTRI
jgi:GTP cyclohydrolase I